MIKKETILSIVAIIFLLIIGSVIRGKTPFQEITQEKAAIVEQQAKVDDIQNLTKKDVDLSKNPNEAGQVMVLMYHNIKEPEAEWVRSPENFRKDLERLYEEGYRPLSLKDYVAGNITTPAGFSPVVLTFDDGRENNFKYLEDGSIDPHCAVGILLDFAKEHEDFEAKATFFINGTERFGSKEQVTKKFDFLIENGMDIGNHTMGHPIMNKLDGVGVQKEIGGQKLYLEESISSDYDINTLALPFGSRPDKSLQNLLEKGTYEGKDYKNIAILNVGWDPNPSPYSKDFNAAAIHRITASETNVDGVGIYDWMGILKSNPERRFISDGVPNVVTLPEANADTVTVPEGKEILTY